MSDQAIDYLLISAGVLAWLIAGAVVSGVWGAAIKRMCGEREQ